MVQCTTYQTTRPVEGKGIQVHLHWGNVENAFCTCVCMQWGQCRGGCVVHKCVDIVLLCTVHKITCTMQYINHALTYNTTRAPHSNSWSPSNVVSHNIPWRCIHPLLNACVDNYMLLHYQSTYYTSLVCHPVYSGCRRPHLPYHSLLWQGTVLLLDWLLKVSWHAVKVHGWPCTHDMPLGLKTKENYTHVCCLLWGKKRLYCTQVWLHRSRQGRM